MSATPCRDNNLSYMTAIRVILGIFFGTPCPLWSATLLPP